MILIGESIHIISKEVNDAVKARDVKVIQDLAKSQTKAGADYIDLNLGPAKKDPEEVTTWLVNTIQGVTDLPISVDTLNPVAMEAGLKACNKRPLLNSSSGRTDSKERMLPLAETLARVMLQYLTCERPARASSHFFVVLKGPRRGQPMTYSGLHRVFRYHRLTSHIGNANPHRFRHTFGANMTRGRMPLAILATMMGHSSPQTTLRYIQLNDQDVRQQYEEAIETLNASGSFDERSAAADR